MGVSDVPEPVARLLDAANRGDTEAFLASFTEDGVVDDWGREFTGAESIRDWSDREFIGVNVRLTVTRVTGTDTRTAVSADVGGDGYNGPSHFIFEIRDDRIAQMTIRQ
jgi:hypothetical protein